jgi:protein CpxP
VTTIFKRTALGVIAVLLSAGVYAASQDQNTNQPAPPFKGGRGGPGRFGGPGGPMGILPMFGRELDLTDTQRDQIKAIVETHRDEWSALNDRSRAAHDALQAAVTAAPVNEAVIRDNSAQLAAVEADLAIARAHVHAEVLQLLTDDQKTKLKELESRRPTPPPSGRRGRH